MSNIPLPPDVDEDDAYERSRQRELDDSICSIHSNCRYLEHDCRICGAHERNRWICHLIMTERQLCFECNHWFDLIHGQYDHERLQVIVDGSHYIAYVDEENTQPGGDGLKRWARGFGGAKFIIHFHDGLYKGQTITSYNVWHQGRIPERFRNILKNNATFLSEEDDHVPTNNT
jgi:hypothetical protein